MLNYKKEVWEGWTVQDFIDSLQTEIAMIMGGSSYLKPFNSKEELEERIRNHLHALLTGDVLTRRPYRDVVLLVRSNDQAFQLSDWLAVLL